MFSLGLNMFVVSKKKLNNHNIIRDWSLILVGLIWCKYNKKLILHVNHFVNPWSQIAANTKCQKMSTFLHGIGHRSLLGLKTKHFFFISSVYCSFICCSSEPTTGHCPNACMDSSPIEMGLKKMMFQFAYSWNLKWGTIVQVYYNKLYVLCTCIGNYLEKYESINWIALNQLHIFFFSVRWIQI